MELFMITRACLKHILILDNWSVYKKNTSSCRHFKFQQKCCNIFLAEENWDDLLDAASADGTAGDLGGARVAERHVSARDDARLETVLHADFALVHHDSR